MYRLNRSCLNRGSTASYTYHEGRDEGEGQGEADDEGDDAGDEEGVAGVGVGARPDEAGVEDQRAVGDDQHADQRGHEQRRALRRRHVTSDGFQGEESNPQDDPLKSLNVPAFCRPLSV